MKFTTQNDLLTEKIQTDNGWIHHVEIKNSTEPVLSPLEEARKAARKIAEQAFSSGLPIKLFLSGGVDSEAMAQAFCHEKIPFVAVIGRYNETMNKYDYQDAEIFCKRHKIEIEYIDVDVFSFLESQEFHRYGRDFECRSPQLAVHLYMLDRVVGFPVLASNPIYPVFTDLSLDLKQNKGVQLRLEAVYGLVGQTQSVYRKYLKERARQGEPYFFQSSSALIFSFLKLPIYIEEMSSRGLKQTYAMKCQAYSEGGFEVVPRKDKYTGFEKFKEYYDQLLGTSYGTGFNIKFREPLEKISPQLPENIVMTLPQEVLRPLYTKRYQIKKQTQTRRQMLQALFAVATGMGMFLFVPSQALALNWCPPCGSVPGPCHKWCL